MYARPTNVSHTYCGLPINGSEPTTSAKPANASARLLRSGDVSRTWVARSSHGRCAITAAWFMCIRLNRLNPLNVKTIAPNHDASLPRPKRRSSSRCRASIATNGVTISRLNAEAERQKPVEQPMQRMRHSRDAYAVQVEAGMVGGRPEKRAARPQRFAVQIAKRQLQRRKSSLVNTSPVQQRIQQAGRTARRPTSRSTADRRHRSTPPAARPATRSRPGAPRVDASLATPAYDRDVIPAFVPAADLFLTMEAGESGAEVIEVVVLIGREEQHLPPIRYSIGPANGTFSRIFPPRSAPGRSARSCCTTPWLSTRAASGWSRTRRGCPGRGRRSKRSRPA